MKSRYELSRSQKDANEVGKKRQRRMTRRVKHRQSGGS